MQFIFYFSKRVISIISMILLLSLFAFPMTSCTQEPPYEEDEAFVKFGVSVKKSDNYETDKQITFNPKEFFKPLEIKSVSFSESSESSWLPYTIKDDVIAFYKLQRLFNCQLTFEVTEETEPTMFYSYSFRIVNNDDASVRLFFDKDGKLFLQTDTAIYCCTDITKLDIPAIDRFVAEERSKKS